MRFGPPVTNPGVRDWSVGASMHATLALQSGDHFDMGVGRSDSSRRVLGKKPMTIETMVEFSNAVRGMIHGDKVVYGEIETQIPWTTDYELPVWIAAYGPKALKGAGEAGDGLVIQLTEPYLVK